MIGPLVSGSGKRLLKVALGLLVNSDYDDLTVNTDTSYGELSLCVMSRAKLSIGSVR
jgi:hypothetical protein